MTVTAMLLFTDGPGECEVVKTLVTADFPAEENSSDMADAAKSWKGHPENLHLAPGLLARV